MQKSSGNTYELINIGIDLDTCIFSVDVSLWILPIFAVIGLIMWLVSCRLKRYKLVKLNIPLGKIGKAEFAPNDRDIQIAHRIWTELVTRKAAIPIDPDNDVIIEVYDSWYNLFTKVRELIADIPSDLLRNEASTKELVRISTATLNEGLRPHLTKWQARFRNWYSTESEKLKNLTPQELQKQYPEFSELVSDLSVLNSQLIQYAVELKKIVDGNSK
ncbi:hypothetical protein [Pseudoalteromonas ardens]|uniref:Uncharacterized protein n=1 Tax=Pseudoalteromonas rubra TaxID=43658 RepID=A0A0L0EUN1_9GAMM|nr:hypothetical protein [Pseudoalteromonas sp. R96]KNC68129.1 hypothetical protein AC626_06550 [Pseudoalteromonas rubra]MDK1313821.1 hypothetical protein [Pseudoalteromonas sp. R96]